MQMDTEGSLSFMPWRASIDVLLALGIERLHHHSIALARRLTADVDRKRFRVLSPTGASASSIVVLTSGDPTKNGEIHATLRASGIDTSLRQGHLRFAPHLYNTPDEAEEIARRLNVAVAGNG